MTQLHTSTADLGGDAVKLVDELCLKYRNWGRWGEDDERGTLNFITPAAIAEAAALVRTGTVVSCALPFNGDGPQAGGFGGRTNPIHSMLQDGGDIALGAQDHLDILRYCDDAVSMPLQCGTQWDALAHIFYRGQMYNGHGLESVTSSGATANSIDKVADGIAGRGVLLDVARHHDVPWLEAGHAINSADLTACADQQGVSICSGDIVLIRTGQLAQVRAEGTWGAYDSGPAPGLGVDSAHWFVEHEIAALATDTWGAEVQPNDTPGVFQPLHLILLANAGMTIGEIFDLERLADVCRQQERYEFFFVAPPLPITAAVGSPVNPLAIF
ncbi:cyclase family protein [Mycolicibacterium smegmatis]|uniref:Cyclase n=1 Tax=Mycolicibacterium smegmatis (strain ATCC 700084 / mc(2)155) TaxID=246196 RepID=A0QZJ6_MYCS2|nr:cyclase family protein [Mycolicibacterium smegmatis]ABK71380.1 cyclase [Mycolicibacterium smegmatis MC2 155]AIU09154.1 cyclase [Mycolicibacterium smegmatis MC2 155]AIU15779.1 cyclase [Mycolicibacterium smegmatis]AIU22402.1 cyclase [Mycolicibacterium smegmatis]MBE9622061.1 cyclase family protein [Mycolicibacterium smegmatis]